MALARLERATSSFGNLRSLVPSELQSRENWSERRESNPQHPVWKTGTQPFEFRSHFDLGLVISDLGLKQKSAIRNPQSEIEMVHRERFELSERERDSFTDCLP